MNKITKIALGLMIMLSCTMCSKKDARNIVKNQKYRFQWMKDGQGQDVLSTILFPRSTVANIIFIYESDDVVRFYLEDQNSADVVIYWDYTGVYTYQSPRFEYVGAASYDENFHRFIINFEVPDEYQGKPIGALLTAISGSYRVHRTNGLLISKDEVVELIGPVTFRISKM